MSAIAQAGNIPAPDVALLTDFVPAEKDVYSRLLADIDWQQPRVRVFGKLHPVPRLLAFQGDPDIEYRYSGTVNRAESWHPLLAQLRDRIEDALAVVTNSVLVNYYRDGRDSMGWHSDDEPELGPSPVIASVSLGACRRLRFRHREARDRTVAMELPPGSLLLMGPDCQRHWQHCVPRQLRCTQGRINLTYRMIRSV